MNEIPPRQKFTPTKRQRECLTIIQAYAAEHGECPTQKVIGSMMVPKITQSSVRKLLQKLERRGWLTFQPNQSRSITLL